MRFKLSYFLKYLKILLEYLKKETSPFSFLISFFPPKEWSNPGTNPLKEILYIKRLNQTLGPRIHYIS